MSNNTPGYLPSLGRLLSFASHRSTALSERELTPHGLTLAHWVILTALWRRDGLTVGELSGYHRSTNAVLTRTLDRMTDRGLVFRENDPRDRRVTRVRLTDKSKALSPLLDFYGQINEILLRGFSPVEERQLVELLERVIANADAALQDGER